MGFVGVQQPAASRGAARYADGGRTNRVATAGAKAFRDQLGLPSFEDMFKKFGGGQGTREFGNAGAASEGSSYLRNELEAGKAARLQQQGESRTAWEKQLKEGKRALQGQQSAISAARKGIQNPTGQRGFQDVMRLTGERLGNAAENDRRLAAEAASRRGYVGGYDPDRGDIERRKNMATAGYEAAQAERETQQKLFEGETGLYSSMLGGLGAEQSAYTSQRNADSAAYASQRAAELGAYSDLTRTAAELPTKWLDSFSNLYGGGGGFGDIFRTSSGNVQFDTGNERADQGRVRQDRRDFSARARAAGASGQY